MEIVGKRVLVVGLGKSGVAAALFLERHGARVTVSDIKSEEQLGREIRQLLEAGITLETGGHRERTFRDQDLIVLSPGVPSDVPPLEHARAQSCPVIGEVELATRYLQGKVIAITGSNGKTTTTTLVGAILEKAGLRTQVGGNIGTPVISLVETSSEDCYNVLEISSFQLETIEHFHPHVAVVLNISPDHLDRHRTFEAYVAAKERIFENQTAQDFSVLNADDPACVHLAEVARSRSRWFSRKNPIKNGAFVRKGEIVWRDAPNEQAIMPVSEVQLKGAHNLENVLAAVSVSCILEIAPSRIREAVRAFRAVEHRLEYVAAHQGVEFYNDSKATNVDATRKALESFPGHIHLILGGRDKGSDYSTLQELLRSRAKAVYTIGEAAEKIERQIGDSAVVVRAGTLETAVRRAAERAQPGDVVLLAPACASFDQFQNYEERGRAFKDAVRQLSEARKVAG